MSLRIDIPVDLEDRLKEEATSRGVQPAQLAIDALQASFPMKVRRSPKDLLDAWTLDGVLGTFSDREDSPVYAADLRCVAEQR